MEVRRHCTGTIRYRYPRHIANTAMQDTIIIEAVVKPIQPTSFTMADCPFKTIRTAQAIQVPANANTANAGSNSFVPNAANPMDAGQPPIIMNTHIIEKQNASLALTFGPASGS